MMPKQAPKQIVMQWLAAYNSHNATEAAALYADDVVNTQMPWSKTVHGREAMHGTYVKIFQAFPDIKVEIENLLVIGDWVVVEWRFGGTMRGEFAGRAPSGRSFDIKGCEVFQITDGKISTQHGYWDKATMFGQLGI